MKITSCTSYPAAFIKMLAVMAALAISFATSARSLRVLAIGNSFSEDAIEQNLYELAAELGDTLIIGNAFIGGCSIERHVDNINNNKPEYAYRKVVDGIKTDKPSSVLFDIITDEPWDIISLQQVSQWAGKSDTFKNLSALKEYVVNNMPNKDAEIVWHMTWAYANDFKSDNFRHYDFSQEAMYDSIVNVVKTTIPEHNINLVIPSGAAIQSARKSFGDVLNRDGYHLAIPLGRYTAACTWCEFLTGKNITKCSYHPADISDSDAKKARKVVHKALKRYKKLPQK